MIPRISGFLILAVALGCSAQGFTSPEDGDTDTPETTPDSRAQDVTRESVDVPGDTLTPQDAVPQDTLPDAPRDTGAPVDAVLDTRTDTGSPVDGGRDTGTDAPVEAGRCIPGMTWCSTACVNLQVDSNNCGACGHACPIPEGAPSVCDGGVCILRCSAHHGNCDGNESNGCEVDLANNLLNCGACGHICHGAGPGDRISCEASICRSACYSDWGDCNGLSTDGCETRLTTLDNCLACGRSCRSPHTTATCDRAMGCTARTCDPGFGDCNGDLGLGGSNGCETDLGTSPLNCGRCGVICDTGRVCVAGVCTSVCPPGRTVCYEGCVDLTTSTTNCGACDHACLIPPNGTDPRCMSGTCTFSCLPGFANCDGVYDNGCEVDIRVNPSNCGGCGITCAAGRMCVGGACIFVCPAGRTACSMGCVDLNTDVNNCGFCGYACGAGQECCAGTCTNLTTLSNCGTCGNVCGIAGQECTSGACTCRPGLGLCHGFCWALWGSDNNNCGACDHVCPGHTVCVRGICS